MANWLKSELTSQALQVSEIWEESHGWDFELDWVGRKYLVVCSCDFSHLNVAEKEHFVQVAHQRSALDKLLRRNKSMKNDPTIALIRETLRSNPNFKIEFEDSK
jgi:hypothetical protein